MKNRIWLSSPHMGGRELDFVNDAFSSNWVAPLGPNVDGFEKDIQNYLSISHAAALSSGTAALHLALILLGVGSGDEVLCQSFTFSATANPILYQRATPIFIDSEEETWNMCPVYLRQAIEDRLAHGKKPKAIIPVHLYGMPANMNEILAISEEFDIPIIEDAAEALGSIYFGRKCGTLGRFGILSFNGNKIITTSGGGALVSKDEMAIQKARFLSTQARDPAPHYQHTEIGYNYRMSNICAGIGRGQMEVLDERVRQRRAVFEFYRSYFRERTGFDFLDEPSGSSSNRWLTCITVDPDKANGITRENIREKLEAENIESRPLWKPMHMQPVFSGTRYYGGTVSEKLFKNGLCLPSGSNISAEELTRVAESIDELY
ncbi:DegT/DnrJ/EryC1/StrS family aminotransferase [Sediminibacterium soli]|uniref:DegT/DnrJ/EryC1/StrS family aminotransferase n=1 Tax=Sediminibacterium soli TaxID=2698829 RepID=UPI00137A6AF2|nr:DegT/DnrJ/EryC1/StrS family aminotransferase [Sediminibacterium soli]NCI48063.1 pyridoxal phosphate-dependent aminotransferase [Sediminibacterium soli]